MSLQPDLDKGVVSLKPAQGSKVWKDPEKGLTHLVVAGSGTKTWDLSNATQKADFLALSSSLWVEGTDGGASNIVLSYQPPNATSGYPDTVTYNFIAADCGNQPTSAEQSDFIGAFPNLVGCQWSITAARTGQYNCIAWSVGETSFWYNQISNIPGTNVLGIDEEYGNDDGVFDVTDDMDPFYLAKKSYTPTATGPADAQVMYYSNYHGAKKKGCACGAGKWIMFESKCGGWQRIEHVWDQLNGTTYGTPTRFYK